MQAHCDRLEMTGSSTPSHRRASERTLAMSFKNENIRAYCISPGSIKTEMGKNVIGQDFNTFMDPEEISKFILEIIEYNGNMICEEVRLNRMFVQ